MIPSLIIFLLCIAIIVGNLVWLFISGEKFADAMARAFYMVLGALMTFFVMV